ncbi:MAG: hypothetical protein HY721_31900 [Planctomycetes bacterium]|nr:hypothetical protein [Planctomycetota bacterium]
MRRRSMQSMWGLWTLLAFAVARGDAGEPAPAGRARVVVLVRAGSLDPAEVSPGPGARAQVFWRLALEGASLARLAAPAGTDLGALEAQEREIFPAPLVATAREKGLSFGTVDLSPPPEVPRALRSLHGLFRAPPPPAGDEAEAVAGLRGAFGASLPAAPPAKEPESPRDPRRLEDAAARLSAAGSLDATLVRLEASSAAEEDVRRRDELLAKLLEAAGPEAHVLVVSLPREGPGSLVGRGPRLKAGRVVDRDRPLAAVPAAIAALLGVEAGKVPGLSEEVAREILQ